MSKRREMFKLLVEKLDGESYDWTLILKQTQILHSL